MIQRPVLYLLYCLLLWSCETNHTVSSQRGMAQTDEKHRLIFHHSPTEGWMNDPNGMVFLDGEYHLFYQHNPDSTVWGPMHWGHAISKNLMHWQEQEIALFPDTLGTIFSGSAVVDKNNTAGFGENALVAIFTHHNPQLEQEGTGRHQYQSIAYSTDKGRNWTKYEGNPVLPNPGIRDFRDPKVVWHEDSGKWVMALATQQTVTFYGSSDLKAWERLSEFGKGIGVHSGVWECPDLISFQKNGESIWALLVSINPGGPNRGSATQYFLGDFDGEVFSPMDSIVRWIDYGRDNYAGVTFSNTGDRKIFMGWMSNWDYANEVPTEKWRSANTFPRELDLEKVGDNWYITSNPVDEINAIIGSPQSYSRLTVRDSVALHKEWSGITHAYRLDFTVPADIKFSIKLSNAINEEVVIGFDPQTNEFFSDRTQANMLPFKDNFPSRQIAPRISNGEEISVTLLVDVASVEVFADGGLTVMTDIFFPNEDFQQLTLFSEEETSFSNLTFSPIN